MKINDGSKDSGLGEKDILSQINRGEISLNFEMEEEAGLGYDIVQKLNKFTTLSRNTIGVAKSKKIKGIIRILLSEKTKHFDPLFIATLCLMKSRFPLIDFAICVSHTTDFNKMVLFYQIGQVLIPASTFSKTSSLPIRFFVGKKEIHPNIRNIQYFFVSSRRFMPLIIINNDTYTDYFQIPFKKSWDVLFEESFNSKIIEEPFIELSSQKKPFWDTVYKALITYIQKPARKAIKHNKVPDYVKIASAQGFLRVLRDIRGLSAILNNYVTDTANDRVNENLQGKHSLGIKGFTNATNDEWQKIIHRYIDSLLEKPVVFIMLFSLIVINAFSFSKKEDNDIEKSRETLEYLFGFTEELFDGIRELAKNICEHASTGTGFLVFRLFDYDRLATLKGPILKQGLTKSQKAHAFINISIIDDSDSGLLMKMEEKLQDLIKKFPKNTAEHGFVSKDLDMLSKRLDGIGLHSFFDLKKISFLHQSIRTAASMGLITFSDLLVRNQGYAFISTRDNKQIAETQLSTKGVLPTYHNANNISESLNVPFGTYYDLTLPVKEGRLTPRTPKRKIPETDVAVDAFEDLPNLQIIDTSSECELTTDQTPHNKKCLLLHKINETDININKGLTNFSLPTSCNACTKTSQILALNIVQKNQGIDASNLLRFLSYIQLEKSFLSVVIYAIDKNTMDSLRRLIRAWEGATKTSWSNSHFVLFFYLDRPQNSSSLIYLPWLLAGEKKEDRRWINQLIQSSSNISTPSLSNTVTGGGDPSNKFKKTYYNNPIFSNIKNIIPIEVILQDKGYSLFEWNAMAEMMQPINFKSHDITGYKFEEAHVKLGSKIHINNFIYAKKMLQNSYYAIRFGYILAQHISKKLTASETKKTVCILSYGLYSELLVSNLARFLKLIRPETKATHAVIGDVDTSKIDHKDNLENNQIMILVPIASTLSTATKIRDVLKKDYPNSPIINKPTNLVIVGHENLDKILDENGNVVDKTVKEYWEKIDLKKQEVTLLQGHSAQDFLLYVPGGWQLQNKCTLCYPPKKERNEEKPLILTDTESLSPHLIFGIPKGKRTPENIPTVPIAFRQDSRDCALLSREMIYYHHVTRNSNHYRYYFDTDLMFKKNIGVIKKWCMDLRKSIRELHKENWDNGKKFIMTPSHATNASFINVLNAVIFQGAATVFYYDPTEDFEENLELFFLKQIDKNSLVFFADDALCSGNTFYQIQNYLKFKKQVIKLSGAFCLLNLLNRKLQEAILHDLDDKLYVLFNLNAPIIGTKKENCYLCKEKKRYEELGKNSILDCIKYRWREKIPKVKTTKYEKIDKVKKSNEPRYLRRLEFVHKLYEFGANKPNDFLDILKNSKLNITALFQKIGQDEKQFENTNEAKATVFKALSQPYFVLYHPIKKAVMRWCLEEIQVVMDTIKNHSNNLPTNKEKVPFDEVLDLYRFLKLLLNRLSFLGSNFPIRADVLLDIAELNKFYREQWRPLINTKISENHKKNSGDQKKIKKDSAIQKDLFTIPKSYGTDWKLDDLIKIKESLNNLNIYYASIVKALIDRDEGKCMFLEKSLDFVMPKESRESSFYSQLRILRIENTTILRRYIEWITKTMKVPEKIQPKIDRDIDKNINYLQKYMRQNSLWQHYRAEQIKKFLSLNSKDAADLDFKNKTMLYLILFYTALKEKNNDAHHKPHNHPQITYILKLLCRLLKIDSKDGGAICIARCGETIRRDDKGAIIYDVEQVGSTITDIKPLDLRWENSFAYKVLVGHKSENGNNPWSNVELIKRNDNFFDYKDTEYKLNIFDDLIKIPETANRSVNGIENIKHLIYIRLPEILKNDQKEPPQIPLNAQSSGSGVIIFFSKKKEFIDERLLRTILLIRDEFAEFISKKFNNDTFRAWLHQEREKILSTIMEHGINRETDAIKKITTAYFDNHPKAINTLKNDIAFFTKKVGNKKNYITFLNETARSSDYPKPGTSEINIMDIKIQEISDYINTTEKLFPFSINTTIPKNIKLEFNPGPFSKDTTISFFQKLLEDILFELARNSAQHSKNTQTPLTILISLRKDNKNNTQPIMTIEDDGCGADEITLRTLNKQGYSDERNGLKMFSLLWRELFNKRLFFESEQNAFFRVQVPLYQFIDIRDEGSKFECENKFEIKN